MCYTEHLEPQKGGSSLETYLLEGFFLEGRPTGPAFQDALAAHHQYIAQQVAAGSVLLGRPRAPGPRPGRHPGW